MTGEGVDGILQDCTKTFLRIYPWKLHPDDKYVNSSSVHVPRGHTLQFIVICYVSAHNVNVITSLLGKCQFLVQSNYSNYVSDPGLGRRCI